MVFILFYLSLQSKTERNYMADIRKMTSEELLAFLKKNYFIGIDIDAVPSMSVEQRRDFTLRQADRLIGLKRGGDAARMIAYNFFTEELEPMKENPLMCKKQEGVAAWIVELARLLAYLMMGQFLRTSYPMDIKLLGIEPESEVEDLNEQYSPDNLQLLSWLKDTAYRRVGARVARKLVCEAIYEAHFIDSALSDYYVDECDRNEPHWSDEAECNDYVNQVLRTVETVKTHLAKGRELGLNDDEIGVVDSLWSYVPHNYQANYVAAARDIVEADKRMFPQMQDIESYRSELRAEILLIAEKHDVDLELDDPYSLPMGYLNDWINTKHNILQDNE